MGKEEGSNFGSAGFALLVVLFILLIIIGTAYDRGGYGGGYCQKEKMQRQIRCIFFCIDFTYA